MRPAGVLSNRGTCAECQDSTLLPRSHVPDAGIPTGVALVGGTEAAVGAGLRARGIEVVFYRSKGLDRKASVDVNLIRTEG